MEDAGAVYDPPRPTGGLRPWHVLAGSAVLLPPVALFAPAGLVILALLAVAGMLGARGVRLAIPRLVTRRLAAVLGALVLWMFIAALRAPNPGDSVSLWLSIVLIFLGGLMLLAGSRVMDAGDRRRLSTAIVAAGVFYVVLIAFEVATGNALTEWFQGGLYGEPLNRGAAVLALFAWPFALAAHRRFGAVAGLAALVVSMAALLFLTLETAKLAGIIGITAFAAVWLAPRPALLAMAVLAAVFTLAVPLLPDFAGDPLRFYNPVAPDLPTTVIHRLLIWQFVAERIGEAPWLGWGLDAARSLPGGDRAFFSAQAVALPLHPHNGALQVWVELGVPGALLGAGLIAAVLTSLWRANLSRLATAGGAALFSAYYVLGGLSFGVWQNWWLVLPWLMAALLRATADEKNGAA